MTTRVTGPGERSPQVSGPEFRTKRRFLGVGTWVLVLIVVSVGGWRGAFAAQRAPLGTNLTRLDDWSTEFALLDVFKTSRPWISGTASTWDDGRTIDVDAHGWVRSLQSGQIARTLLFWATGMQYPAGRYVVEYEGEGTLVYWGGARLVESAPGRDVVEADPARGGIAIYITAVNPSNYLRNISVRMPSSAPATEQFNLQFLSRIRNYRVLRFMDWMATNGDWSPTGGTTQQHWADRPKLDDARWSNTRGVPVETMVALANEVGADAWFCMPHLADDDYVRQFAQTVGALLAPGRRVYVEYSNEVWNGGYAQARYAQQQGLALGLSQNAFEAQIRFHARRSREIFAIWESVIPKARLVRVLGSFAANSWTSETALSFGDTAAHTDVLAIAPYFGIPAPEQSRLAGMSVDDLLTELRDTALPQSRTMVEQHAGVAARHSVGLVTYESGQHLVGVGTYQNDAAVNALFDAANRDARMRDLYWQYLQDWTEVTGGQLLMHYTNCSGYSRYGRFGSMEYLTQDRAMAPKYDALQRWISGWDPATRYGDLDASAAVDQQDLRLLQDALVGNGAVPPAADVHSDGRLDALDAHMLSGFLAARFSSLPFFP